MLISLNNEEDEGQEEDLLEQNLRKVVTADVDKRDEIMPVV